MHTGSISGDGKCGTGLEAIIGSAQRGKSLVSQLLMFARKTETTFETVQVNEVVTEIETLLTATFPKTIQITTKLPKGLPHITADPNQLHQVLLNTCVNARDAMPKAAFSQFQRVSFREKQSARSTMKQARASMLN